MATVTTPMTMEEFLALPDDGVERWLIAGELREGSMTTRNRYHSRTMTVAATRLENWSEQQLPPRGQVLSGGAGVRVRKDPETVFGIDIIYVSAERLAQQTSASSLIDGAPTLAVEILSPNDTLKDIEEKIDALLEAGTPLIWIINPRRRTVTVYRPGAEPELFNVHQELAGDPHLPGFRIPVQRLFD